MLKYRYHKIRALFFLTLMAGASPSFAADPANGSKIYGAQCVSCHGVTGTSAMPDAPDFSQGEGLMSPDSNLLISIQNGKAGMPAYRGVLSDQDILDVIAYLRTLN